jgi:hypothetical protein
MSERLAITKKGENWNLERAERLRGVKSSQFLPIDGEEKLTDC